MRKCFTLVKTLSPSCFLIVGTGICVAAKEFSVFRVRYSGAVPFLFAKKNSRRNAPGYYGSRFASSKYGELKKSEILIFKPWQISWIKRSLTESYAQFTMFPMEDLARRSSYRAGTVSYRAPVKALSALH